MINPYILKHTSRTAPAHTVNTFLRDYFAICQRIRGKGNEILAADSMMVHDLENETAFPVWVVRVDNAYGLTHDPNKPPKAYFDNVQLLTTDPKNPRLKRVDSALYSLSLCAGAEDAAQTALRSMRGWYQQVMPRDPYCSLFLVAKADYVGVIDPYGKTVVPPVYRHIIPMSLTTGQISLLICRREDKNTNTADVYDINGNCIYKNIGGIYRYKDTVKYDLSPTQGNHPWMRFAKEVCVAMYGEAEYEKPKIYVRTVQQLHHSPALDKDDAPKRLCAVCDDPTTALEPDTFELSALYDILEPMLETVAAWRREIPEEVMLSIPVWNVARQTQNTLPNVTANTSLIDIPDLTIVCFELLQRAGIHTAGDLANADLFPLCENADDRISLEMCVLQGQILTTLNHNQ